MHKTSAAFLPHPALSLLTLLVGQSLTHGAMAAGLNTGSLDPVVVSATRTEQGSFTLPMAVDAVDADRLRDAQLGVNLSETLNRIPGIVVQNRQNYAQDLQVSIRGFGSRSTFGTRGIRLLVDDIPTSSPDGQGQAASFDLDSAKSVEVLRGPFATIYGNASGGVIRAITRDGSARPRIETGLLFGSYGAEKESIEASGSAGTLNYLIDASQFRTNGYRQHSQAQRQQTNAKFTLPTDSQGKFTLVLNAVAQPDAQDPGGLNAAQLAANPRKVDPTVSRWNARKTLNNEQVGLKYERHLDDEDDLQMIVYTGQRRVLQYLANASLTAPTAANGVVDLDRKFGGGDGHLTHHGVLLGGPTEVTLGASYELQNENRKAFTSIIDSEGYTQRLGNPTRFEDDEVTAANTYLQGQWTPLQHVLLAAGVRHSLVEFSTLAYLGSTPGSAQYSNTSPTFGISFQPRDTVSLYANYGRGFETPSFSELAYTPIISRNTLTAGPALNYGLRPSTSSNYELGTKLLIDADTRANAALFQILTRDELAVLANVSGRSFYQNVPGTTRNGVELSVEHDFLSSMTAYGAFTWLDATYSRGFASQAFSVNGTTPPVTTLVQAGSHLPGIGRRIAYGELSYHTGVLSTAIEARYSDKVYANDTNNAAAASFAVFNLRAALNQRVGDWRLDEFVRVDNLFNRAYVGSVIINESSNRYFEPSPDRTMTVGVRANYEFN